MPAPERIPADNDRLDRVLVARGLVKSRARAQALIAAGQVIVDGQVCRKAARPVSDSMNVTLAEADHPWVSRGAFKLIHGLDHFHIDVMGRVALDLGASTGGFTQVLLDRGVRLVYAVDVGRGQLAASLREDDRVVGLEGQDARALNRTSIAEPPEVITCDASFISLVKVLPVPLRLAAPGAALIALIKPQFEVGRAGLGKGGIVRDAALALDACERIEKWLTVEMGWNVQGVTDSPITGGDGNKEFLIAARSPER